MMIHGPGLGPSAFANAKEHQSAHRDRGPGKMSAPLEAVAEVCAPALALRAPCAKSPRGVRPPLLASARAGVLHSALTACERVRPPQGPSRPRDVGSRKDRPAAAGRGKVACECGRVSSGAPCGLVRPSGGQVARPPIASRASGAASTERVCALGLHVRMLPH